MTDKWADYVIVKVKYSEGHDHIVEVKICEDNGANLGEEKIIKRQDVINLLKKGKTFITAYAGDKGYRRGAEVHKVVIDGYEYIKTERDNTKADNLGELPEF